MICLFGRDPELGLRYLVRQRFAEHNASSVARFLVTRKGLSKLKIGEYLGNLQQRFNMDVLGLEPVCPVVTFTTHGSYGQGKSGKKSEDQGKSGNFTFQSRRKLRGSGNIREFKSTRMQKLTKTQKKI